MGGLVPEGRKAQIASDIASTTADYNSALSAYNNIVQQYAAQHPEIGELGSRALNIPEINSAYQTALSKYDTDSAKLAALGVAREGNPQALARPGDYTQTPHEGGSTAWAKLARTAAPALLANFIAPGLGGILASGLGMTAGAATTALGGALAGGGLSAATGGNALMGALGGGLGGYAQGGGFGDIAGGLSDFTDKLGLPSFGNAPVGSVLGSGGGEGAIGFQPGDLLGGSSFADPGALSGLGNAGTYSMAANLAPASSPSLLGALGTIGSSAATAGGSGGAASAGNGILDSLLTKVTDNPLGALGAVATIGSALGGNTPAGTQSQEQILAQKQAQDAQQAAQSAAITQKLNSSTSQRHAINPGITDYYSYGSRPQAMFFDQVTTPITY